MPTSTVSLDRAHLAFALALHRAVAPDPAVAACWSPYSVASALGLAATGARGETRDELVALLLGDPSGPLTEHATLLSAATDLGEPAVLGVSNTLWTRQGLPITESFATEVRSWPNGTIRDAPFTHDPESARELINAEVRDTTHGLIRELVRRGEVDKSTAAVLVNALYLKSSWRNQFPERATQPRPFHAIGDSIELPTMRLAKHLPYARIGGWQVVVLPAAGGVDAVVLLPDGDLREAEPGLNADALAGLLAAPGSTKVELHLPRFRVKVRTQLTEPLRELGVRRMFTRVADFSGITETPVRVSRVLHDAVLTVDERGFEGAAATALAVATAMAIRAEQPVVVRVDRPFLMLVRHRNTGAIYFLARFTGRD